MASNPSNPTTPPFMPAGTVRMALIPATSIACWRGLPESAPVSTINTEPAPDTNVTADAMLLAVILSVPVNGRLVGPCGTGSGPWCSHRRSIFLLRMPPPMLRVCRMSRRRHR